MAFWGLQMVLRGLEMELVGHANNSRGAAIAGPLNIVVGPAKCAEEQKKEEAFLCSGGAASVVWSVAPYNSVCTPCPKKALPSTLQVVTL